VDVGRHVDGQKRYRLNPGNFSIVDAIADTDWRPALQVGKCEGLYSIPAVRGPDKRKKCLILIDWQYLPVGQSPPLGCEVKAYQHQLGDKRL
jgi:hypothetical protein